MGNLLEEFGCVLPSEEAKVCTQCGGLKALDQFNWATITAADKRAGIRRRKAACKVCCMRAYNTWRERNLEEQQHRERASHYKSTYKLDSELANALANPDTREGLCPICGNRTKLVLDHNHTTGSVRELICSSCNSATGYTKESLEVLKSIIRYLEKHNG